MELSYIYHLSELIETDFTVLFAVPIAGTVAHTNLANWLIREFQHGSFTS